ncbi:plasmid mobilization protein [Rurimicrobium arvi]
MARPQKPDTEKSGGKIQFRVNAAEKERFETLAANAGVSITDLIKKTVLGAVPKTRKPTPDRTLFLKALAELGKIGSNCNQIARALNRRDGEGLNTFPNEIIEHALQGVSMMTRHLRQVLENNTTDK